MENKEQPIEMQAPKAIQDDVLSTPPNESEQAPMLQNEDYTQLNKHELVKALEKLLSTGNVLSMSRQVKEIKEHFIELAREEYNQKLSKFMEDGSEKEDFAPVKSHDEQQFDDLLKKYNQLKGDQSRNREKQLTENLRQKQQLIEDIKKITANSETAAKNFKKIQEIQASWKIIGQVPAPQADELWKVYKFNIDRYFDLLHLNKDLQELGFKRNLELKAELCEKAEKLANEPSIQKALDSLRVLQQQWRESSFAGKEHNETILERFKAAENNLAERSKAHLAELLVKQGENLKLKLALCEEFQAFNEQSRKSHKEWETAQQQLEQLWERWRKIGPVPESDNDNAWKTFKKLRQEFYHLKDAFYIRIREEQQENLAKRITLCEQAEALQNSDDWIKTASILKRLQDNWKTIGPGPKHKTDKIWHRFRTACDAFFNSRKQHLAAADAELEVNATAKQTVIEQIKQLIISDEANQNVLALRDLQQAWIQTGKAPEHSFRQLNKAYKDALDEKMQQMQQKSGVDNGAFTQMRYEQQMQTSEGQQALHKERSTLADKVKRLKHEIATQENNLSFFGKSKGAAILLNEYTQKVETMKEELKALEKQLKIMPVV